MNKFRLNLKKDLGQAMVEFAIALPILLLVVYGLIETGRLLFIYSSVNTASRQAVRYGSTTGENDLGVLHYMDCDGIRAAAQRTDFLGAFSDDRIHIFFDDGLDSSGNTINEQEFCTGGSPDTNIQGKLTVGTRITVKIYADFHAIFPKLVPFLSRTDANGNPITAISSRTLLQKIDVAPDLQESTTKIDSVEPSPSQINDWVTVTVTVTGTTPTPTGFVTVSASDGTSCTAKIELTNGTGWCNMQFTAASEPDTVLITATYEGDNEYNSSSDSYEHMVNKYSTTASISQPAFDDVSQVNDPVTVVFSITGGDNAPTGTVNVTGADTNCSVVLTASDNGTGSCDVVFTSSGTKTISVQYMGDTDYAQSNTATRIHKVIQQSETATFITSDNPDSSQVGETVNVAVKVVGTTTPTGTVDVTTSDGQNCSFALDTNGNGSCSVTFNSIGSKTIFATYNGDVDHTGSSDSESHAVDLPPTTTTITTDDPDASQVGQSVLVTVTVTAASGTPTGTVDITGASTNCTITLSGGTGSCNVTFNSTGTKTLSAQYSGDSSFAPSNDSESHTVSAVAPIAGCNSTNVTTGFINIAGSAMTINITNNLTSNLAISDVTVTWNHDKGHQAGADKSLQLISADLAGVFWTGTQAGPTYTIVPATTTYVPASATTALIFTFHQSYDNTDTTESITINFSTPGCEGFTIVQN